MVVPVSVTEDDPLLGGEPLQPDRAAGVKLVGGNADLGAKAELK